MQNRTSENPVFGTRFLFDSKYAIICILLIEDWVSIKYKYMEPIRTCTNTSFGQFDERCKIYVSLQTEQKNVNKTCLSIDNKTQRRRDAENPSIRQRVSRVRESWPTSQPMAHLKTFVGRFILQVSIKL